MEESIFFLEHLEFFDHHQFSLAPLVQFLHCQVDDQRELWALNSARVGGDNEDEKDEEMKMKMMIMTMMTTTNFVFFGERKAM